MIPPKANRKAQDGYGKDLDQARRLLENIFCQLKQFRAVATRCVKPARNVPAAVYLAAVTIWLN